MENFRKLQNEELHRISTEQFKQAEKLPVVIVLDNIRSQNNVGSVFRTSDAFRIEKIYLCGITSTPENREVHKTALGAEDAVDWEYQKDTLVFGNEVKGVQQEVIDASDNCIEIPQFGTKHSFNIAVTVGIVLWQTMLPVLKDIKGMAGK